MHDLSEYDSGSWNTSYQLSEEEARIEALCDEERYLALHTDLLEEEARQGGPGWGQWDGLIRGRKMIRLEKEDNGRVLHEDLPFIPEEGCCVVL